MGKIGIIGAMDEEIDALKEEMNIQETREIASMVFYIGTLNGREIILVRCGIGKVNAAICTQILIGQLGAALIINTGVAGAIEPSLDVLDVVISTEVLQHDFDATGFGYEPGVIPRMEHWIFPAEERLVNHALLVAQGVVQKGRAVAGRIASGDIFVSSKEKKEHIWKQFKAHCVEMEGAAIGHVCHLNKIPFLIIRTLSDRGDGSAHVDYPTFVNQAAHYSKEIVKGILA